MSEPSKAVFLSYASQDAEPAKKICDSLRAAGVEVWFDSDGGLEQGDEWDRKIRRQIKECVLFLPVISANTQARHEGYFRIEWELATDRAMGIASGVPFLLPIVIDGTREPDALVPDRFRKVQWTRIPGGVVTPDQRARFLKLWSHRTGVIAHEAAKSAGVKELPASLSAAESIGRPSAKVYALMAVGILAVVGAVGWWLLGGRKPAPAPVPAAVSEPAASAPIAPVSEARQLAAKVRVLIESLDSSRDDFKLAGELLEQAKAKDGSDAEVWAAEAQLDWRYILRGWDFSDARREAARAATQRALRLDPQSFEARLAQAALMAYTGREGLEKEKILRGLRAERPADHRVLRELGETLERLDPARVDEAAAFFDEAAALPGGDSLALYNKSMAYWFAGRPAEADAAMDAAIAQRSFTGALLMKVWYAIILHGDLVGAQATLERIPSANLLEDRASFFAFYLHYLKREPDAALAYLNALPRDWLTDNWYTGPKGLLIGDALQLGGRAEAAAVEWRAALKLVEARLSADPTNSPLRLNRLLLLASLGEREEAARQFAVELQVDGVDLTRNAAAGPWVTHVCILLGRKEDAIRQLAFGLKHQRRAAQFTAARLRLDPLYDPLRGDPEFQKVIAETETIEKAVAAPKTATMPLSEARQLAAKARALFESPVYTRDDLTLAEDLCKQAVKLEPNDGEVWAVYAELSGEMIGGGMDYSMERREAARVQAERAVKLAPDSSEARYARAGILRRTGEGSSRKEAEDIFRELLRQSPEDPRFSISLAKTIVGGNKTVLDRARADEALALFGRAAANPAARAWALRESGWLLWDLGRYPEAEVAVDESAVLQKSNSASGLKVALAMSRGDLALARTTLLTMPGDVLRTDAGASMAARVWLWSREPEKCLEALQPVTRDYLSSNRYTGPTDLLRGQAHQMAGKLQAAANAWRAALLVVEKRLETQPRDSDLLYERAHLLALLGERVAANTALKLFEEETSNGPGRSTWDLTIHVLLDPPEKTIASLAALPEAARSDGVLRFSPEFDPLRGDPRFEALLAGPEKKSPAR